MEKKEIIGEKVDFEQAWEEAKKKFSIRREIADSRKYVKWLKENYILHRKVGRNDN